MSNISKSKRSHFINPYTFVPLSPKGPLLKTDDQSEHPTHLFFDPERFTGTIKCELDFITPAVIPGEQIKAEENKPGKIEDYTYDSKLAIPGSRLRGHLLNLMRSLNSSPVTSFDDRTILKRISGNPQKGFVCCDKNGAWSVQEIKDEILVAHKDRRNLDRILATEPVYYPETGETNREIGSVVLTFPELIKIEPRFDDFKAKVPSSSRKTLPSAGKIEIDLAKIDDEQIKQALLDAAIEKKYLIPEYNPKQELSQGVLGVVYYKHPQKKGKEVIYKKYLVHKDAGGAKSEKGRWVAFPAWSGQDGKNRLKDINGNLMAHRNCYHVVDLSQSLEKKIPLTQTVLDQFDESVNEMARLAEGDEGKGNDIARSIRQMSPLKPGDFVYFADNNGRIESISRHFRYLCRLGTVKEKVERANEGSRSHKCIVKELGGWADEKDFKPTSMKSRLWVEMAMGPDAKQMRDANKLTFKNLRILSSQPPKSAQFYLEGGDYNATEAKIRGRKIYWHDSKWDKPMWDNEDLEKGQYAFENPLPDINKKQWSKAEVLFPAENGNSQCFEFKIRVMNLSDNELNLLLTALLGFRADNNDFNTLTTRKWCHKVGHARPFLGSAAIKVTELKQLGFNPETLEPAEQETTDDILGKLEEWQTENMPENEHLHIRALKQVMAFAGAGLDSENELRISYPLYPDKTSFLFWDKSKPKDHPKTFKWFAENQQPLPTPGRDSSQALSVEASRPVQNYKSGNNGGAI